jgi:hypothetical protein
MNNHHGGTKKQEKENALTQRTQRDLKEREDVETARSAVNLATKARGSKTIEGFEISMSLCLRS